MIYYTRTLKTGETYTTGYKDQSMAKRIANGEAGSTNKRMWDGELYFNLETGKYGADASGVGLMTVIESGNSSSGGRFAVFSIVDGKPNDLGLRFTQYGEANKFVRAIAGAYGKLFVLEMEKQGVGKGATVMEDEEIEISSASPF